MREESSGKLEDRNESVKKGRKREKSSEQKKARVSPSAPPEGINCLFQDFVLIRISCRSTRNAVIFCRLG